MYTMAEVWFWLIEFAKGAGRFFLHPVFYFSIILALTAGFLRVKRERKDFNSRLNPLFHELSLLFPAGLLPGLVMSILMIGIGMVVSIELLVSVAMFTILLGIAGNSRLLSPALTIGLAIVSIFTLQWFGTHIPFLEDTLSFTLIASPIILGLFIFTEGFLMEKNGLKDISPKLRTSRRGLTVGAHQIKRLWIVPVFFLLPGGSLTAPVDWWPVFQFGTETYSPILIPFALGFQQQIHSTVPKFAVKRLAKQVMTLGVLITAGSAFGFLYPTLTPPIAAGAAIIGRLWISYRHRVREHNTPYFYTPRNSGVMVLGVIPGSPADKMGLKTGEIIQKCNSMKVATKHEFYHALQKNRAYCKLDVYDTNGEIRFVQRALYENDHHELGILFIEKRLGNEPERAI